MAEWCLRALFEDFSKRKLEGMEVGGGEACLQGMAGCGHSGKLTVIPGFSFVFYFCWGWAFSSTKRAQLFFLFQ